MILAAVVTEDRFVRAMPVRDLVHKSVIAINEHYHRRLTLDDLARSAMLSKFYFLRQFQAVTGVTPARFLSAVRINEAKRLLFTASSNVADISIRVGYDSPGTFTRRFTECVGLPPTRYRLFARGDGTQWAVDEASTGTPAGPFGTVSGVVNAVPHARVPIFIGLYRGCVPRGLPVAASVVPGPGPWQIPAVPPGTWHLLAVAGADAWQSLTAQEPDGSRRLAGSVSTLHVRPGTETAADVTVERPDWCQPPLLVAVPGTMPAA
jgi:AraC family transcriptional regulator